MGGGPAGLLAATRCAEAGLDVHLFEEHACIGYPAHCTGIVSLEAANLTKIPDEIILSRPTQARLISPRGVTCGVEWNDADREPILVIDRAAFDQIQAERARSAGAVVHTGTRIDMVSAQECRVDLAFGGGLVQARAAVLACGVSYQFQRRLGLGLPGHSVHTAQVEVNAEPSETVDLYFGREVAPEGFVWTVPVMREGHHRLKIGALSRGDAGAWLDRFLRRSDIRARLRGHAGRPTRRLLPLARIAKTYADRMLVVGDAGGFTKPTTGGGIFYSLMTASLAAETMVEAFDTGRFDEGFLGRYEHRWKQQFGRELRVAEWLRRCLTRCTDAEVDQLVSALSSGDMQAVIHRTARFNWHRTMTMALVRRPTIAPVLFRAALR